MLFRKPININERYIKRIALSDKESYGEDLFKYFIEDRHEVNALPSPLCTKPPLMN